MDVKTSEIQSSTLKHNILQFLTPTKISEIATRTGYDSRANFTSGEYQCLLNMTTTIVLEKLRRDSHLQSQDDLPKNFVISIVDEALSNECKRDFLSPDIVPLFVQNFLASVLWKLTSSFYEG